MRAALVLALVLAASACGGSENETAAPTPVRFHASDGVQLAGMLFGSGAVAVVCSHMGRPGDTQEAWFGLARALAARGYLVLTYNRRGIGPSKGLDTYSESWRDVVGADEAAGR